MKRTARLKGGHGVLVDELHLPVALQQQGELVVPGDCALEHDPVDQKNGHRLVLALGSGEEDVLQPIGFPRRRCFARPSLEFGKQVVGRLRRHDRRDAMLVDQLAHSIAAQQQREGIEPGDDPLKLDTLHQEDRHRRFSSPYTVQKMILQREGLVGHYCSSPSRLSPSPSAFSLRWSADRSMPMNDAVREMLPEKRRI